MTTYCLEMRSTANWQDIRYREYTTSKKKAELFKQVPRIRFTDSGHHIVPHVTEHTGRRLPRNMILRDHVVDAIIAINKSTPKAAKQSAEKRIKELEAALEEALEYFEDRYDVVDGSYGEPSPNREMALGQMIDVLLHGIPR